VDCGVFCTTHIEQKEASIQIYACKQSIIQSESGFAICLFPGSATIPQQNAMLAC